MGARARGMSSARVGLLSVLVLVTAQGGAALLLSPARLGAQDQARIAPERAAQMQVHFGHVLTVYDAVIRGDLAAVKPPATWLAEHDPEPSLPTGMAPHVAAMKAAARRAADAETVLGAAIAAAAMLKTCGDCHRAAGVARVLSQTPPGPGRRRRPHAGASGSRRPDGAGAHRSVGRPVANGDAGLRARRCILAPCRRVRSFPHRNWRRKSASTSSPARRCSPRILARAPCSMARSSRAAPTATSNTGRSGDRLSAEAQRLDRLARCRRRSASTCACAGVFQDEHRAPGQLHHLVAHAAKRRAAVGVRQDDGVHFTLLRRTHDLTRRVAHHNLTDEFDAALTREPLREFKHALLRLGLQPIVEVAELAIGHAWNAPDDMKQQHFPFVGNDEVERGPQTGAGVGGQIGRDEHSAEHGVASILFDFDARPVNPGHASPIASSVPALFDACGRRTVRRRAACRPSVEGICLPALGLVQGRLPTGMVRQAALVHTRPHALGAGRASCQQPRWIASPSKGMSVLASRPSARRSPRTSLARRELGGACCVYHRGEKVVDLWGGVRNRQTGEPWERGHDGDRLLGHQGPGGDDAGARALARLARLRRARVHLLAGVRAAGQGADHRPSAAGAPGGAVSRSTSRSIAASSPTSIAWPTVLARQKPAWEPGTRQAYHAHHARLLRGRAAAPHRSAASQPRTVLPGRDRVRRSDSTSTSGCPRTIPNSRLATHRRGPAVVEMLLRLPAAAGAGGDESALQYLPGAQW